MTLLKKLTVLTSKKDYGFSIIKFETSQPNHLNNELKKSFDLLQVHSKSKIYRLDVQPNFIMICLSEVKFVILF